MKDRIIPLKPQEYSALKRALQWPEDLAQYDKVVKPTNLTEINLKYQVKEQK